MRILLTHHLPLEGSASGRQTRELALGLMAAGHDVQCLVVYGRRCPAPQHEPFPLELVRCWPGDAKADLPFDMPALAFHPYTQLTFNDLRDDQVVEYRNALRRRLDRCVERFDPHLIHCQHAWLFAHLALESGAPYVIGVFGDEWRALQASSRYRRLVEQAVENASRLLVYDDSLLAETASLFPETMGRIERIAPPISVDALSEVPSRSEVLSSLGLRTDLPMFVYASDLTPNSCAATILNAHAALTARGKHATLVLCGEGPQRSELQLQARYQKLNDVYFVGELLARERSALLAAADGFLAGSPDEYTAVLEAMSCGTPVIVADHARFTQIVTPELGDFVKPNDHELLAASMEQALNENWKQSKGARARQAAVAVLQDSAQRHAALYQVALIQRYGDQPLP